MKKAQMELLGLAIVIVLIALGVMFIVRFNILKEPSKTRQSYTASTLASNTVSALLVSNTVNECANVNIRDLLIDCAENLLEGGSITCSDGDKSCEYVNDTLDYIFNNTLEIWGHEYVFNASTTKTVAYSSNSNCTGERKSSLFFFETSAGTLFIRLDICG